jgi:CRISPR-associated endonuclease/helicase Cas3
MDSGAIERARRLAGYPKGARHELMSVALMMTDKATGDWDNELLLHLVASHHGRCRPFAPVIEDHEPVEVRYETAASSSDHRLEGLSSGISLRFWKLGKRYGWYGLAYLEMLVRLADHRRSEEEELQADA